MLQAANELYKPTYLTQVSRLKKKNVRKDKNSQYTYKLIIE